MKKVGKNTRPFRYGLNQIPYDYAVRVMNRLKELDERQRSSIQSAKTRPGVDCGSDYQLPIAKFRLKLKKVGKTTRLYRYDVNKIPYDYLVEVTNRFKGLDLVDRVLKNYRWRFVPLYRRW